MRLKVHANDISGEESGKVEPKLAVGQGYALLRSRNRRGDGDRIHQVIEIGSVEVLKIDERVAHAEIELTPSEGYRPLTKYGTRHRRGALEYTQGRIVAKGE